MGQKAARNLYRLQRFRAYLYLVLLVIGFTVLGVHTFFARH